MIVVMEKGATPEQIRHMAQRVESLGLKAHVIQGTERTVIAAIGEKRAETKESLASGPGVADVRGLGLLVAAELTEGVDARKVAADALASGLVINAFTPTALRLAPPLLVTEAEIDEAMDLLAAVLAAHTNGDQGTPREDA